MTIFAVAPVPDHHRLDRGKTVDLSKVARVEPAAALAQRTPLNQTADSHCPPWCDSHVPTVDGGVLHVGDKHMVLQSGGGTAEWNMLVITVEQLQHPDGRRDPVVVRIGDTPTLPSEVLDIMNTLQAVARDAMGGQ